MSDELAAEVILGSQAEHFIESDLGRYLLSCAEQEAEAAYEFLRDVRSTDSTEILQAQNKIWRAESFKTWLIELIQAGRQADHTLRNEEN